MAPKGKADYAFLLHDLYHIKPDGIMAIVLPHGVLFRGDAVGGSDGQGEGEGRIRRNLIENNHIEAIIGLPANIFFGTGIPTIIMVLRQKRRESDVLFIDASKSYTKVGKTNKLMASDIKRIVDTVTGKKTVEKYSRLVTKKEIQNNSYNLNIPRYVDSSVMTETWDIYATMFGGIPNYEIELLKKYWDSFPELKTILFSNDGTPYSVLTVEMIRDVIEGSRDVKAFEKNYREMFADFGYCLKNELIDHMLSLNVSQEKDKITENIFERIENIPLVDKYQAYQLLDDEWGTIGTDLEVIQTEGFAVTKQVDPNMVMKKKGDKEAEVQEGWIGHVIPFELVQKTLLSEEYEEVKKREYRLEEIASELVEIIESIPEDERGAYLNDVNNSFSAKEFSVRLREIYEEVNTPELMVLRDYIVLFDNKGKKSEKLQYILDHGEVKWNGIEGDAPYTKNRVLAYKKKLQKTFEFPEDSFEAKMVRADELMDEEKQVKKEVKEKVDELHFLTKTTIENLTDDQVRDLLYLKWIEPLSVSLQKIPETIVSGLEDAVQKLAEKYEVTYMDLDRQIKESENTLSAMMDELTGDEYDMKGIAEWKALLQNE